MILVDIEVPKLDEVFDFELDEEVQVGELTQKIGALISQERGRWQQAGEAMDLYAFRLESILDPQMTLSQQKVQYGDRLILI